MPFPTGRSNGDVVVTTVELHDQKTQLSTQEKLLSLRQFITSLSLILHNRHINHLDALQRHFLWQFRKLFNTFPCELTLSKSRILAFHRRCGVSALVNSHGMYDFNNMNFIQLLLKNGGKFFDIGANIGAYTLLASEMENAEVFSFEPHPITFRYLMENVRINVRQKVHLFNVAVSDIEEVLFMTDAPGSAVNRIVPRDEAGLGTIEVPSVSISRFVDDHAVIPDFVKIDVEGAELDVLKSFGKSLESVKVFFVEIDEAGTGKPGDRDRTISFLADANFIGPLYVDFINSSLLPLPLSPAEDAVFVARHYLDEVRNRLGFDLHD